MTITRMIRSEVNPTPEELAEEFWSLGGDEQARFFDALANKSSGRLTMQLQSVADSSQLTNAARFCMQSIGEYGA